MDPETAYYFGLYDGIFMFSDRVDDEADLYVGGGDDGLLEDIDSRVAAMMNGDWTFPDDYGPDEDRYACPECDDGRLEVSDAIFADCDTCEATIRRDEVGV